MINLLSNFHALIITTVTALIITLPIHKPLPQLRPNFKPVIQVQKPATPSATPNSLDSLDPIDRPANDCSLTIAGCPNDNIKPPSKIVASPTPLPLLDCDKFKIGTNEYSNCISQYAASINHFSQPNNSYNSYQNSAYQPINLPGPPSLTPSTYTYPALPARPSISNYDTPSNSTYQSPSRSNNTYSGTFGGYNAQITPEGGNNYRVGIQGGDTLDVTCHNDHGVQICGPQR